MEPPAGNRITLVMLKTETHFAVLIFREGRSDTGISKQVKKVPHSSSGSRFAALALSFDAFLFEPFLKALGSSFRMSWKGKPWSVCDGPCCCCASGFELGHRRAGTLANLVAKVCELPLDVGKFSRRGAWECALDFFVQIEILLRGVAQELLERCGFEVREHRQSWLPELSQQPHDLMFRAELFDVLGSDI